MTMEVRGPGGVTVRFPDGTDPATIDRVMRSVVSKAGAPAQAPAPQTGGVTPAAAQGGVQAPQPTGELRPYEPGFFENIGNTLYDAANAIGLPGAQMRRDVQGVDAAVRGAADTATFGLADEFAAGMGALTGIQGEQGNYSGNLDFQRAVDRRDEIVNPVARMGGQVGGAIATVPFTGTANVFRAATAAPRIVKAGTIVGNAAVTGAGYGAGYGFGSGEGGLEQRMRRAADDAMVGGLTGAASVPAVAGVAKLGQSILGGPGRAAAITTGRPVAEREVVGAIRKDAATGGRYYTDPSEIAAAQSKGIPMAAMDVGESTRDIARGAADISSQGRAVLNEALDQRQATQADRIIDNITTYAPGVNAPKVREYNLKAARAANQVNYDRAYRAPGADGIWHEGFEQLTVSPEIQAAIREAEGIGRNASAIDGSRQPMNPFRSNPDGTLNPIPDVMPSLQFWDKVKQSLDGKISVERGPGGNKTRLSQLTQLKQRLVSYLDDAVPEYRTAREGAFGYFQADNALEAGANFVRMGRGVFKEADAVASIQKMTKPERDLFAEGYATQLIADIQGIRDSQAYSVVDRIFNSRTTRQQFEIALGKEATSAMEATIRLEKIMQATRKYIQGGSHTAQYQLAAQALLGTTSGAAGLYFSGGDWSTAAITAALVGVGSRLGGRGMNAITARANEQNARRIAEMLASDQPQVVQEALSRIARNPTFMDNLRAAHGRIAKAAVALESGGASAPAMVDSGTGSQPAQAEYQRP